MFGYRDPMRDRNSIVGGNGMAVLGKGIFAVIGGLVLLGACGGSGIVLLVGILIWVCMRKK